MWSTLGKFAEIVLMLSLAGMLWAGYTAAARYTEILNINKAQSAYNACVIHENKELIIKILCRLDPSDEVCKSPLEGGCEKGRTR